MFRKRFKKNPRRGASAVQVAVVLAVVVLAVVGSVRVLGIFTEAELNDTSNRVADPSQLPHRFSPDYSSGADAGSDSGDDSGDDKGGDSGGGGC